MFGRKSHSLIVIIVLGRSGNLDDHTAPSPLLRIKHPTMNVPAFCATLYLTLIAATTQTSALETSGAKQGGIFSGAGELTNNAGLRQGKATKAPATPMPTGPTSATTSKSMTESSRSGKVAKDANGIVISGADPSFEIVSCDSSSVEVKGKRTAEIKTGNILVYVPHDSVTCSSCNPLFRRVQSIRRSKRGNLILTTTFLTVSEIIQVGMQPDDIAIGSEIMEPLFDCPHSSVKKTSSIEAVTADSSAVGEHDMVYDNLHPPPPALLLSEDCDANWLQKNSERYCAHTNCYIGMNDASICFGCDWNFNPTVCPQKKCDHGCSPKDSIFNTDGNFGTYDFGSACCNHDYCWSSNSFTKEACDLTFLDGMNSQCSPPILSDSIITLNFPVPVPYTSLGCNALAALYYAVSKTLIGANAYDKAQSDQKDYEQLPQCNHHCLDATELSGGQGTTEMTVDMIYQNARSFLFSYNESAKAAQLSIEHDGQVIFDTDVLISGEGSADVQFGVSSSTIIKVTITAPEEGTIWDVTVGCPYPLLFCPPPE